MDYIGQLSELLRNQPKGTPYGIATATATTDQGVIASICACCLVLGAWRAEADTLIFSGSHPTPRSHLNHHELHIGNATPLLEPLLGPLSDSCFIVDSPPTSDLLLSSIISKSYRKRHPHPIQHLPCHTSILLLSSAFSSHADWILLHVS